MSSLMKDGEKEIMNALPEWKGYDIDELRYRRAYLLARCEIERMRLVSRIDSVRASVPLIGTGGVAGRLLKGLSYLDYVYIAYKLTSKASKILSKFRNKK